MCKASAGIASDGVNTEAWAALAPDELALVFICAGQGEIGPPTESNAIRMRWAVRVLPNEIQNVTNRKPGYMA